MKPVYKKRHRFNWKDLTRIFLVAFAHYFGVISFTAVVLTIRFLIFGGSFFIVLGTFNWWIIYAVAISPGINTFSHLIYSETGWLNYKAFIWIHSFILSVAIPLIIFISF